MNRDSPTVPCRSCGSNGLLPFLDLGITPLADALVRPDKVGEPEDRFPLEVAFCPDCTLTQILEEVPPEKLFVDNYLYFSSFSDHLLAHSQRHADWLIAARNLGPESLVVELASNDGYLLKNFVDQLNQLLILAGAKNSVRDESIGNHPFDRSSRGL